VAPADLKLEFERDLVVACHERLGLLDLLPEGWSESCFLCVDDRAIVLATTLFVEEFFKLIVFIAFAKKIL
jgi:hypothetical protein